MDAQGAVRGGRVRRIGRAIVVVGLAIAVLVTVFVVGRFVLGIHDRGSLPGGILICDRTYAKDASAEAVWTMARMRAASPDFQPVVVSPGPWGLFTACVPGVCTATADGPCATVIFVRVDWDAYVAYSLQGGP